MTYLKRIKYQPPYGHKHAGVVKLDNDAGLKIPSLVVHGFESHPPHHFSFC